MATQQSLLAGSWRRGMQALATLTVLAVMLMAVAAPPATAAGAYSPASDVGSLYHTTLMTGAQAYWKAGFTGRGIDWAGRRWSGSSWTSDLWAGRRWSGVNWSGRMWSGDVWSSAAWN